MTFDEFVQAVTATAQARIVKEGGELQDLIIGPDPWSVCWTFRRVFVKIERRQTGQIVDYTLFKKAEPSEVSGAGSAI